MKDIKGVVGDDGLTTDMVDTDVKDPTTAYAKIEAKLIAAKARLDDARMAALGKARRTADLTDKCVKENPWSVLGVAAVVGLLVGFISRRR